MTYVDYSAFAPITNRAYVKTKLIYGVGRNDSLKPVLVKGKATSAYNCWRDMLRRCYSSALHIKQPTYVGCSVSSDWFSFSCFESWYTKNFKPGLQLDKDLLLPGNRIYSADTCIFVPQAVNTLLMCRGRDRGLYPLGVCSVKGKFLAQINLYGCPKDLGLYSTPQLAHKAWQLAKAEHIASYFVADSRIRYALDLRVAQLRYDAEHNLITEKL